MMGKTPGELHAAQTILDSSNQLQEKLNAATEDVKYEILAALLAFEELVSDECPDHDFWARTLSIARYTP